MTPSQPLAIAVLPVVVLVCLRSVDTPGLQSNLAVSQTFRQRRSGSAGHEGNKVSSLSGLLSGSREGNLSDSELLQAPYTIDFCRHVGDFAGNSTPTGGFILGDKGKATILL